MSLPTPLVRRCCALSIMAAVALLLLAIPSLSLSQQPSRDQKIAELEKQLADLQKKLDELKRPATANLPKPIAMADILAWKGLHGTALSPDGQWFAYRAGPAEGNGEVVVRQTKGDKEFKFSTGQSAGVMTFSANSKWLAFAFSPPGPGGGAKADSGAATPAGGNKVGLVDLASGTKVEFEGIRRFVFSGEAATHLALHKTPTADGADAAPGPAPAQKGGKGKGPAAGPARSAGSDLILHELAGGNELTLGNVAEFAFDKKGRWLALAIDTRDQFGNGIQLRDMTNAALSVLDSGKAVYQRLAWTDKGDGMTVLKGVQDKAKEITLYTVLGFTGFGRLAAAKSGLRSQHGSDVSSGNDGQREQGTGLDGRPERHSLRH